MELKKTTPLTKGQVVLDMQRKLNQARYIAMQIVREDINKPQFLTDPYYFQTIHHRDEVPPNWRAIREDGEFGNETENAVKGLQRFLFITENGIMGDTTNAYLNMLLQVRTNKSFSPEKKKLGLFSGIKINFETGITAALESFMKDIISSEKFQKEAINDPLTRNELFRKFVKKLSKMQQTKALNSDPKLKECQSDISKIEQNRANGNYRDGHYENSSRQLKNANNKLNQIIRKIKDSNKIRPRQMANKISGVAGKAGKGAGAAAKWWEVGKVCVAFLIHLLKWDDSAAWMDKAINLFYEIIDQIMIVVIATAITAGVIALLGASWPVWAVIVVSVLIALLVDFFYQMFRKNAGSEGSPLTLSLYNGLEAWINSLYIQ